eukprot:1349537-Rhodomonas_salina.2
MRCDAMRCDAMRCDAMQCDAMRCAVLTASTALATDARSGVERDLRVQVMLQPHRCRGRPADGRARY